MATSGIPFKVEQFDGKTSFTLWQRRVKDLLVQQGLAKALKEKPTTMEDDEWEELETKCVSTIRLCIADNIVNNVIDEDSASEIWKKLESLYLAKSLTTKLHLKRQLYRLKMAEGGNLMEHMNVFNGYLNQLKKVDVKIEEEDRALLLLTSLPDSYDALVTTLLYGKDTISMEQVQSALVSHATQKKSNFDDERDSALLVKGENRGRKSDRGSSRTGRSRSSGRGKGPQCYYCNEWGHIRRLCPKRNKDSESDNGNIAAMLHGDGDDVLLVSDGKATSPNDWILDSGCVRHVCSDRKCFDTFQAQRGEKLSVGNGAPVRVLGVGTVKIKMFDGAVRTLGGVAFAPKMRKNLISLSRLDSKGCRFAAESGAMKVTRGCMVLMKGEKYRGLYRLIGRTVVPNASTGVWKWRARAKDFQGRDDDEVVKPVSGEGGSRPSSKVKFA